MGYSLIAGADAPRLFILRDLFGDEAARLVCPPADLRAELDTVMVFGLTDARRAELTDCLSEWSGAGRYSAGAGWWTLTSEPIPPGVLAGALALGEA